MNRKNMLVLGVAMVWIAVTGGLAISAKAKDFVFTEYGKR